MGAGPTRASPAGPCRATGRAERHTHRVSSAEPLPTARGTVRLFNTSGGRALCLAGDVDAAAVEGFLRRYGREPARVEVIDVRSVTALSESALDLVLDHLDMAERTGRPVRVSSRTPAVDRLLADHRSGSTA